MVASQPRAGHPVNEVTLVWTGFELRLSRGAQAEARRYSADDARAAIASHLEAAYAGIEPLLRPEGLHAVADLPLWELVKDTVYSSLRDRLFVWLAAHQVLETSTPASVTFIGSNGSGTAIEHALRSTCRAAGIPFIASADVETIAPAAGSRPALRTRAQDWLRHRGVPFTGLLSRPGAARHRILLSAFYKTNAHLLQQMRQELPPDLRESALFFAAAPGLARHYPGEVSVEHYGSARIAARVLAAAARVRKILEPGSAGESTDPGQIARSLVIRWLRHHYGTVMWNALAHAEALDALKPELVVTTTQWGVPAKAHVMAAHARGIPVIWLQHGLATLDPLDLPVYFEKLAVWGERDIDLWTRAGVPAAKIAVTGAVNFDHLANETPAAPPAARASSAPTVLFTSQPTGTPISPSEHRETLSWWFAAAKAMPRAAFVIKPHPVEDADEYARAIAALALPNLSLARGQSTDALLRAADVTVTIFSSTGMTAVALGRPVIVLRVPGVPDRAPYVGEGVAIEANSAEGLVAALSSVLDDARTRETLARNRPRFLTGYLGPLDGGASRRVASLVAESLAGSQPVN